MSGRQWYMFASKQDQQGWTINTFPFFLSTLKDSVSYSGFDGASTPSLVTKAPTFKTLAVITQAKLKVRAKAGINL